MIRCCLCRRKGDLPRMSLVGVRLELTDLPGSGHRCIDHDACTTRVREIIAAHVALAEVCE